MGKGETAGWECFRALVIITGCLVPQVRAPVLGANLGGTRRTLEIRRPEPDPRFANSGQTWGTL